MTREEFVTSVRFSPLTWLFSCCHGRSCFSSYMYLSGSAGDLHCSGFLNNIKEPLWKHQRSKYLFLCFSLLSVSSNSLIPGNHGTDPNLPFSLFHRYKRDRPSLKWSLEEGNDLVHSLLLDGQQHTTRQQLHREVTSARKLLKYSLAPRNLPLPSYPCSPLVSGTTTHKEPATSTNEVSTRTASSTEKRTSINNSSHDEEHLLFD